MAVGMAVDVAAAASAEPVDEGVGLDLTARIVEMAPDAWADPDDGIARYWIIQAVRKMSLVIGDAPVRFVAGAPFAEAIDPTPETPGAVVVFTDDLMIRADISSAPGDTPGMRVSVAAIPRSAIVELDISPAPMNLPPSREWPRQAFLSARYLDRPDPLTLPMVDTAGAEHRRDLLTFLPSLVADLTRAR